MATKKKMPTKTKVPAIKKTKELNVLPPTKKEAKQRVGTTGRIYNP